MTTVSEGSCAYSGSIASIREVVVWLPPAKLLRRCGNTVLFLVGMRASLPNLVKLLVLTVFPEVVFVVFLLEHFREAISIRLGCCLVTNLLLHDIVMLEIVEVRVLSFEKMDFVFDLFSGHQSCVTRFFLNRGEELATVISIEQN